jgi:hypothetical protein
VPEGKYSAESIHRVARIRISVLKKGSPSTTQASRDDAKALDEETSNDKLRRTFNISCSVSKFDAGGAACRLPRLTLCPQQWVTSALPYH